MVSGTVFCHSGPFLFRKWPAFQSANFQMLTGRRGPGIVSTSPETHLAVSLFEVYRHQHGGVL